MKEIVILGAGYGGLSALRILQKAKANIHITLIDRNDYHYRSIRLEEVASGAISKRKATFPLKEVEDKKNDLYSSNSN